MFRTPTGAAVARTVPAIDHDLLRGRTRRHPAHAARRALVVALVGLCSLAPASAGAAAATRGFLRHRGFVVVTSASDDAAPANGATLRSALAAVRNGGRIIFHPRLDGARIDLLTVGEEHSMLPAETYDGNTFRDFVPRDHGRSALYAQKNVTIDASALPHGVTIAWAGSVSTPARVLAVYGNLTMINVTVTGGHSVGEPTGDPAQPYTLARGGGIASWGTTTLVRCTVADNRADGDEQASRDRGAFGGGVYGDRVVLEDSVVAGNVVTGFGAAGGGVYSVGGRGTQGSGSSLIRCAVTGNLVVGEHAYGGGVFSAGGGPARSETLALHSCTIARNRVMDNERVPESPMTQYYYRGGGVYMSNGSLRVAGCTVVENEVTGHSATFSGKPNMGGGGIAATIGNAHVVQQMELERSIVAGNTLGGVGEDVFTGSLIEFVSSGYNRVGRLDMSQMLVPIPAWLYLSRKHWPAVGDRDGIALGDVVMMGAIEYHGTIKSAGVAEGTNTVLSYVPTGSAVAQVPCRPYGLAVVRAGYTLAPGATDRFLNRVVERLRTDYADRLGSDFGAHFGDLSGITFTAVPNTWPAEPANAPWIRFWRDLDAEIAGRLGAEGLGDEFWRTFTADPGTTGVTMDIRSITRRVRMLPFDQFRRVRCADGIGDIGAREQ